MSESREQAELTGAERSMTLDEATPPLCPAPMPRQAIVFWSPRLMITDMLEALKVFAMRGLRYPGRVAQRATITLPNVDER